MKQIAFESILFYAAFILHTIAPYMFYFVWIVLILLGRRLVKDSDISLRKFIFAMLVGAPLGVLAAASASDYFHTSDNVSALIGCGVAILAEQILDGSLPNRIFDATIEKFKR